MLKNSKFRIGLGVAAAIALVGFANIPQAHAQKKDAKSAKPANSAKNGATLLREGLAALDKREFAIAAQSFGQAAEKGQPDGAFYMARMFELGVGIKADPNAAINLYTEGSKKGSALAMNRLGMLHLEGLGVLQDYEKGAKLVCGAAEKGDANGQFNCALVHLEGRGTKKNEAKGATHLQKAAQQNHIGAQNILAQAYISGAGVKQDKKKALQLFQKTAAVGNPVGLFSLGQAYALGLGVKKDLSKAHAYFNLAATRQHPDALEARQAIERQLKPEQIIAAHGLARAWRPVGGTNSESKKLRDKKK